jgi:hypothetical protein
MEIIISGEDKNLVKKVEDLARSLGLQIKRKIKDENRGPEKTTPNGEALYSLMTEMAKSGGIKSIPEPLTWQKELRQDRTLYGREN